MSLCIAAETISYISYIKDINERSRLTTIFYGFVPLAGVRLYLVSFSMRVMAICQLIAKALYISILIKVGGKRLMFVVLVVDMLVYLSYKVVRQDFRYWMNLPNASSLVISFIVRVVLKIVTDFTGFLHARHPYEMGGSYWLFNMMLTHATVFGSIWLLEGALLGGDEDGGGGGNIATYYKIAQILSGVWACALVGLVAFSEREFVETFYSSRTGKQYCKELFKSGNHETMFCEIFDSHKSYWKGFEVELKEFLKENWDMWHMNRPEWFTDATKAMVPLYMIADKGGGGEGDIGQFQR